MLALVTPYAKVSDRTAFISGAVQLGLLLLLWAFVTIPIFPSLQKVLEGYVILLNQKGLIHALMVSIVLNIKALSISVLISLSLAYLYVIGIFRPIANLIAGLNMIGIIGVTFIILYLVKDIDIAKVYIVVFGITPYLLTGMLDVVNSVKDDELEYARTLKMNHWQTTWHVIMRGQMHQTLDAIRQNAPIGWMMVAAVEGLVRTGRGVGVLLVEQNKYMILGELFAVLITIYLVGKTQDLVFRVVRRILCPYATINNKGL